MKQIGTPERVSGEYDLMTTQLEAKSLARTLSDDSGAGSLRRWWAAKQLARLAQSANGTGPQRSREEARAVVEGLAAGLEGVHSGPHRACQRALERLTEQSLIEAVCDVLLEKDFPRVRMLAVHGRYQPQDPIRRAA